MPWRGSANWDIESEQTGGDTDCYWPGCRVNLAIREVSVAGLSGDLDMPPSAGSKVTVN